MFGKGNRPPDPAKSEADTKARRILMASVLYYGCDTSIVSDRRYDRWCREVADTWELLDPFRQWQLRSPDDIRSSGFDVRVTSATIGGAAFWMVEEGLLDEGEYIYPRRDWKRSEKHGVYFLFPENFGIGKRPKPPAKKSTKATSGSGFF